MSKGTKVSGKSSKSLKSPAPRKSPKAKELSEAALLRAGGGAGNNFGQNLNRLPNEIQSMTYDQSGNHINLGAAAKVDGLHNVVANAKYSFTKSGGGSGGAYDFGTNMIASSVRHQAGKK